MLHVNRAARGKGGECTCGRKLLGKLRGAGFGARRPRFDARRRIRPGPAHGQHHPLSCEPGSVGAIPELCTCRVPRPGEDKEGFRVPPVQTSGPPASAARAAMPDRRAGADSAPGRGVRGGELLSGRRRRRRHGARLLGGRGRHVGRLRLRLCQVAPQLLPLLRRATAINIIGRGKDSKAAEMVQGQS